MILVTGASGFVGGAFTRLLDERGIPYRCASRSQRPGFVAIPDWESGPDWSAALEGVDTVVHLAGRVHVMSETASDPLDAFRRSNVNVTVNLARQASERGVSRFVYASSIKAISGDSTQGHPYSEADVPAPDTDYGISKLEAELRLAEIAAASEMAVTIVRPPLVYGPGAKANFLALASAVHRGIPLPLGLVRNRRSMVFVGNLADFLLVCCQSEGAKNQTFMVSDGDDMSTAELVRHLARGMGRKAFLLPVPPVLLRLMLQAVGRRGLALRLLDDLNVDIGHARSVLGWRPPVSARDGLELTARAMFPPPP